MGFPLPASIFIGFDTRETAAFAVAVASAKTHLTLPIPVRGVVLSELRSQGLYRRPTVIRDGILWDVISEAPMSTEHAIARFLVPRLARQRTGWVMFADADILVRGNLVRLFDGLDDRKAAYCVQHPVYGGAAGAGHIKMDGQLQTTYARKYWSSVFLLNCGHPQNDKLTVDLVNTVPGRDLHRFCWLEDDAIGALDMRWNYLVGVSPPTDNPQIVHYTLGTPDLPLYAQCEFSEEWRAALVRWASGQTMIYIRPPLPVVGEV